MSHDEGAVGPDPVLRVAAVPGSDRAGRLLGAARDAAGETRVVRTGPTGVEALEPLVLATRGGETCLLADPAPAAVRAAAETLADGGLPEGDSVEHDPGRTTLPQPADGPLAVGRRRLLDRCGWVDPTAAPAAGGSRTDAGELAVDLLGRGRGDAAADESVRETWRRVREADGDPVVVVNAHETDDRPRADRTLLAGDPGRVLAGAAAVARHVGAEEVVCYLAETERALIEWVEEAAAAATLDADVQVVAGPDLYRAGAPTAALEAMEGADRIEPRLQPPGPAEHGLYGRPTAVHTPRTFAHVRRALAAGGYGGGVDPGTRLVTVAGDVERRATVELPPDADLGAAVAAVETETRYRMACVGGPLGGLTRDLDVAPTARALSAAGLGTDGVVELLAEGRCPVADAGRRARFAAEENSGRCVPGREGTQQLTQLLRDVYDGAYDAETIRELGRVMRSSANCRVGTHAPRPAVTAMDEFGAEFRAHAEGRCPAGACEVGR